MNIIKNPNFGTFLYAPLKITHFILNEKLNEKIF